MLSSPCASVPDPWHFLISHRVFYKKTTLRKHRKKRQIAVLPVFQYTNAQKVLQGTFSLVPSWPWSAPFAALACLHQANRLQLAPDTGNQPN